MQISKLHFFGTNLPLDGSAVYFSEKHDNYFDVMHEFPSLGFTTITLPSTRSVKTVNRNFTMTVQVSPTLLQKQQQYCVVETPTGEYHYYFVRRIESEYDNVTNDLTPTCTCEFINDPWGEFYDKIKENKDKMFPATRLTTADMHLYPSISPYPYRNINRDFIPAIETHEVYDDSWIEYNDDTGVVLEYSTRYMALWLRVRTDGELCLSGSELYENFGCYPKDVCTPYLLVPYAILDRETMTLDWNFTLSISKGGSSEIYGTIKGQVKPNNITNILSADLTAFPPFRYHVDESGKYLVVDDYKSETKYGVITNANGDAFFTRSTQTLGKNFPVACFYAAGGATHEFRSYVPIQYRADITRAVLTESNVETVCPLLTDQPPFTSHSVYYNGVMESLVPVVKGTDYTIKVSVETSIPMMTITYDGDHRDNNGWTTKPIPLVNSGEVPTSVSAYDTYMRSYGNQIIAQEDALATQRDLARKENWYSFGNSILSLGSSATQIGMGISSGNAGGIARGVTGMSGGIVGAVSTFTLNPEKIQAQYDIGMNAIQATLADKKNQQDQYRIPSASAFANLVQDGLLFRKSVVSDKKQLYGAIMQHLRYGYETNCLSPIIPLNHELYDFIQLRYAFFSFISDKVGRAALENMYRNGLTIWYIDSYQIDDYGSTVKNIEYTTNNLQRGVQS